ncbi:isoleucine--tRNA ligase [Marinitoga sp. 1135]|uniref:Isoleucine--tRNA ligase n=1 Tax=Marinitoga piezophila (strain DSM 14283 / JCM 11233 / KA3) TaxID=443254 RepID=H2J698_MARPK|nr:MULTISPECIES: isoleucine--tRNA ligase [Marinitoga]AEX86246.1 isoleucyl-tRNA synthetase [Marinitoga piezophila KA3]NUU96428.1 isoleucine--tRNA ligase [Marinitoga sp. 1135]NUU98349.1 isoleucine--tRNA ligase [Marinitoga sp. 1138]
MDYKDTLNLPKTPFSMKANLKKKEPETLKKWEEMDLEHYVRKEREKAPVYILHDGPPYANGHIHIGHVLNKILKDIIIKYKTMQGFKAPYVPGWDTHGLPIEHKVTTELGDKAKQMSKLEIRKLCEKYALDFVKIQKEEFKRLGVRGDWEHPYVTLEPAYEAKVLGIVKKLTEDGNIFRSKKPIYWCPSCETALAEAEIEYHDHTSPSIYVKFEMEDEPGTYIVIWTTTPWTLPANVAIALHPEYDYVKISVGEEKWILAEALVENLMKVAGIEKYEVLEKFKGKDLEYKKAKHPFMDRESLIVLADYVTLEDGTGCVHTAPGHGADDYQTGLRYKLPVLSPVNHEGVFTNEAGKYAGLHIWKANKIIIEDLKESGHLIARADITHSYPHCWRCKNPVIFRATEQWFISVDSNNLRQKALDEIKNVEWIPEWGENRITAMVQDRPDWCISRQRAWGIPIPALYCEDCGETFLDPEVLDKVIEIVEKEGTNAWYERPVEDFLPEGYKCPKCGGTHFKKEEDILDVWIDSGSSWDAVVNVREDLGKYPVDLYLEGTDQHRGWFQSSLFLSVAKNGKAPFKAVLTHGFIKDKDGRKMSKSLGNVISPFDVIDKYGADILRLWVASSDYRGDIKVSFEILKQQTEVYRKYRNTIRFLLGNTSDFDPEVDAVPYEEMEELDKWAMMKIHQLIKKVTEAYENYEFFRVHHLINNFCTVEMSSMYLDIIKDRIYTELPKSRLRRSAQTVMYEALVALTKLMVPLLAFTTEEIYSYLPTKKYETVQLEEWPEVNEKYFDKELEEKWNKIFQLREDVTKALEEKRREKFIGHPLDAKIIVEPKSEELKEILASYDPYFVADLFITSQFELGSVDEGYEGEFAKVKVVKAEGKKCERCWKIHPEVGNNEKYPDACPRCIAVLEELNK